MIRTFIDTGVLITAARGSGNTVQRSLDILQDPDREFASSPFLKLELLPKCNERAAHCRCRCRWSRRIHHQ